MTVMPSRDIDVDSARGWITEDVFAENFTLYGQATYRSYCSEKSTHLIFPLTKEP